MEIILYNAFNDFDKFYKKHLDQYLQSKEMIKIEHSKYKIFIIGNIVFLLWIIAIFFAIFSIFIIFFLPLLAISFIISFLIMMLLTRIFRRWRIKNENKFLAIYESMKEKALIEAKKDIIKKYDVLIYNIKDSVQIHKNGYVYIKSKDYEKYVEIDEEIINNEFQSKDNCYIIINYITEDNKTKKISKKVNFNIIDDLDDVIIKEE